MRVYYILSVVNLSHVSVTLVKYLPELQCSRCNKFTCLHVSGVTRGVGVFKPPPEIPKTFQNRAKLNPIVKTVKNLLNLRRQHPKVFGKKKAVKF